MKNDPMTVFAHAFADRLVERLAPIVRGLKLNPGPRRNGVRHLDMKCRIAGCKQRSRGPRFRYMCVDHEKLPKKEQRAALAAYAKA